VIQPTGDDDRGKRNPALEHVRGITEIKNSVAKRKMDDLPAAMAHDEGPGRADSSSAWRGNRSTMQIISLENPLPAGEIDFYGRIRHRFGHASQAAEIRFGRIFKSIL
jgi:hypothetical protein